MPELRKFTIRKFTITIFNCEDFREWKDGEKRCFLHFKFISDLQSVLQKISVHYTQFNYYIKSRESAKNAPVLDDLLGSCKSYLVQDEV